MAPFQCLPESITTKKTWPYYERYHGEKDEDNRRSGYGEYYWSNAESLESYEGPFFRDTMHGWGTYRWRWLGENGDHIAYEGYFFANKMHGYGSMSYPDGRTFLGLFCNDLRWGPGIMRHACRRADVGLWKGNQLVRLAWRPPTVSLIPDIASTLFGQRCIEQFRITLYNYKKTIGNSNSALDLLKQQGMAPLQAGETWKRLYSKYCTDMESVLCDKSEFYRSYYGETMHVLEETLPDQIGSSINAASSFTDEDRADKFKDYYFAWNNNSMILHMMKHAFQHEQQRHTAMLELSTVLSGPRQQFLRPGSYELDCRTILLASYLGDKSTVLLMIQEHNVYPNVSDIVGNTAIMYATCGNQTEIIHHLVEAGAAIDTFNDACLSPLAVALLIYVLTKYNVPQSEYGNVLISTSTYVPGIPATDWHINRNLPPSLPVTSSQPKTTFGLASTSMRKVKSQASMKAITSTYWKKRAQSKKSLAQGTFGSATELDIDEGMLYRSTFHEYELRIATVTQLVSSPRYPKYLFELRNMIVDVESLKVKEDVDKISKTNIGSVKDTTKNSRSNVSKSTKSSQKIKTGPEIAWQQSEKGGKPWMREDAQKIDSLNNIKLTILHLLLEGANPQLVRCPQPAMVVAIIAGSADIVNHLIRFGADVNERYPQLHGYTPLQVAVSRPLSRESLEVTKFLLKNGAKANDRLREVPKSKSVSSRQGPTLIHALIGRPTASDTEEELRKEIMELLLEHGCDAYAFYEGRSAIDYVMEQSLDLLDVFINSDTVSLNGSTSSNNQSMLAKLLSVQCFRQLPSAKRLRTKLSEMLLPLDDLRSVKCDSFLFGYSSEPEDKYSTIASCLQSVVSLTNIVLFGADPLLPVHYEEKTYGNIFLYAKRELDEIKSHQHDRKISKGKRSEHRVSNTVTRSAAKSYGSRVTNDSSEVDEVEDYERSVEMVTEAARQLQVRWIQSKLVKELIELIMSKRPGRPWHMIVKEHQNETRATLWLTAPRCFEIWNILKQAQHPIISSQALRPLLAIVHYYNERHHLSPKLVFKEKEAIDRYVQDLITQPKVKIPGRWPWHPRYTTPELSSSKAKKFKICFECCLPLSRDRIECEFCNLVYFCNWLCMGKNTRRPFCHPCSPNLIKKYFQRVSVGAEGGELEIIYENQEEA